MSVNQTHTKTSRETFWATDTGLSPYSLSEKSLANIPGTHTISDVQSVPSKALPNNQGAVLDDRQFFPAPAFLKIKVDFQRGRRHVRPVHPFPKNQLPWKRTKFPFLFIQIAIRIRVWVRVKG